MRPVNSTSSTSTTDPAGEVEGDVGDGLGQHRAQADVVAVEGDVEAADRHLEPLDLLERRRPGCGPGARHRSAGRPAPRLEAVVALEDLVGHAA